MRQSKLTAELKTYAQEVANKLPERLLKGDKARHKSTATRRKQTGLVAETNAIAELSYNQLAGEWLIWYQVARRFEHKAKAQDRGDLRHTIILRLAQVAKHRSDKPITEPAMYRIASVTVADYWRAQYKLTNGLDCGSCSKAQRQKCRAEWLYPDCPKAIKLEYLSKPITDSEGNITELGETIADDHAIDLDAWLDNQTFIAGCPKTLILIVNKIDNGKTLSGYERLYLYRYRHKHQKRLL